jgi:CRP-like cAMP-binding protein
LKPSEFQISLLQSQPLFGGITDEIVALILDRSRCVDVPAGGAFFREGDAASSMYVLEKGRVAVFKDAEGMEHRLGELQPGDCFGEMALMDMKPRSASVVAQEDCTAIEITPATLHHVFSVDPEQFAMIEMNMGREVCRRLRAADSRLIHQRKPEDADGD